MNIEEFREYCLAFSGVTEGFPFNESTKHWNTIVIDGSVPDQLLQEWITNSYDLVVQDLQKKSRKS